MTSIRRVLLVIPLLVMGACWTTTGPLESNGRALPSSETSAIGSVAGGVDRMPDRNVARSEEPLSIPPGCAATGPGTAVHELDGSRYVWVPPGTVSAANDAIVSVEHGFWIG